MFRTATFWVVPEYRETESSRAMGLFLSTTCTFSGIEYSCAAAPLFAFTSDMRAGALPVRFTVMFVPLSRRRSQVVPVTSWVFRSIE